jgi:alpha-ketoglutaric semialdehyde dehydrogenase
MKPALLLVDLQRDYLTSPGIQPAADTLVRRSAQLLSEWRSRCWPVIHIWTTIQREEDQLPHWRLLNRPMCAAGHPGHSPPDSLRPVDGEVVVHKTGFNAFRTGDLDSALRNARCRLVVFAGLHLHTCIRTAAMECLERGYDVAIAEDAAATNDPVHAAAARRWLSDRCVRFESASGILARLDQGENPQTCAPWIHRSPRCLSEELFEVPIMGRAEVERATASAKEYSPRWQRTPLDERLPLFQTLAGRLEALAPDLAKQMAEEIGKPLAQGLEEVHRAATNVRDVVRRASATVFKKAEGRGAVRYRPHGVVAIVPAWNNPVAIPLGKIAPALVYGNTVVWKPAPAGTNIARTISGLLLQAGVPAEALHCLTGDHSTAQLLAANDHIDAVTFTGSTQSGYAMQEICARLMRPLQAELGGNNGAIVWTNADLRLAANEIARGALGFAGQRCTANRRVIVSSEIFEAFLAELVPAAERMTWGDPLEEKTEIGPMISEARRDEVDAILSSAHKDGLRAIALHAAHASLDWVKKGAYAQSAIICCDDPQHSLVQEETMGPVLVVQRANTFEEALALCNGVRHGLIAALFTNSPQLQTEFLKTARAGILKLNASTAGVDVTLPFGGWKASGIGPPEHGEGDPQFYLRSQATYGEFPE